MKYLCVIFLVGCVYSDDLHNVCPSRCYTGPSYTENIGICKSGWDYCNDDYSLTGECVDEVLPEPEEICDGLDNNCDGLVDMYSHNFLLTKFNTEDLCRYKGVCKWTTATCKDGGWKCDYPDTYEEIEVTCDGLDNDCDGEVDEGISEHLTDPYCYDGPAGTQYFAPCHPGYLGCKDGKIRCVNQVIPHVEVCDGIDNDCNGLVDDTTYEDGAYDIVISLDKSGSMDEEIYYVTSALEEYVEQFSEDNAMRFAVIEMSGYGDSVNVVSDFASISEVIDAISETGAGEGYELSYDAIYEVCDLENNPLNLSWNENSWPVYLGFTDEEGQSDYDVSEHDLIDKCIDNEVLVFQWSDTPWDFEELCEATGGKHFTLIENKEEMLEDLNTVISTICR